MSVFYAIIKFCVSNKIFKFSSLFNTILKQETIYLCTALPPKPNNNLFNVKYLRAHVKISVQKIIGRLFSDDAHSKVILQQVTSCNTKATKLIRIEMILKRAGFLHQPAPNKNILQLPFPSVLESWYYDTKLDKEKKTSD